MTQARRGRKPLLLRLHSVGVRNGTSVSAVEARGHGAKCAFAHPTLALREVGKAKVALRALPASRNDAIVPARERSGRSRSKRECEVSDEAIDVVCRGCCSRAVREQSRFGGRTFRRQPGEADRQRRRLCAAHVGGGAQDLGDAGARLSGDQDHRAAAGRAARRPASRSRPASPAFRPRSWRAPGPTTVR